MRARWGCLALAAWLSAGSAPADNLLPNGRFDDSRDPLHGWHVDYDWTRNEHYQGNASRVSVIPREQGQGAVLQFRAHGQAGSKAESAIMPFAEGDRLRATFQVRGGPYRVYFAGHQWKPGVRPGDEPALPMLRQVYRSLAATGEADGWRTETIEIPGTAATPTGLQHLRRVRFVTLYLWFLGEGAVADVRVERVEP